MHHSTACPCSSCESVGLSPVVPTGTRPSVPSAICQSTRPRKTFSSSAPLPKGVTNAVNEPRKLVLAVMMQSSESSKDSVPMPYCTDQLQTPQLHSSTAEGRTFVAGREGKENPTPLPAAFSPRSGLMVRSLALHQGSIK